MPLLLPVLSELRLRAGDAGAELVPAGRSAGPCGNTGPSSSVGEVLPELPSHPERQAPCRAAAPLFT